MREILTYLIFITIFVFYYNILFLTGLVIPPDVLGELIIFAGIGFSMGYLAYRQRDANIFRGLVGLIVMFVIQLMLTVTLNLFQPIITNPPSLMSYLPMAIYYFTPFYILGITIISETPGEQQYLAKEVSTIRYF